MQPEELFQAAQARAQTMPVPRAPEAPERLRTDLVQLLARLPEPPLYVRADDPARRAAQALLPEVQEALARTLALCRLPEGARTLGPLLEALREHAAALCHVVDGRLGLAEEAWERGRAKEREASRTRLLLERGRPGPAYERGAGRSRYDPEPRPRPPFPAKLLCPNTACRRVDDYPLEPARALQRFECRACGTPFEAFCGEVRRMETRPGRSGRDFRFDVAPLGGGEAARVEFVEASGEEFHAAPRDLVAFLYAEPRKLRVVVNLTNLRFLWVSPAGGCFVATVAFGEGAPELEVLRAWRDGVLGKSVLGRLFIRGYYRAGPGLAARLERRPRVRRWVRAVLVRVHGWIARSGQA